MRKRISYDKLFAEIEKTKNIIIADAITVVNELFYEDDYEDTYEDSARAYLNKVVEYIADCSNKIEGNVDEMHNMAVSYARNNMYQAACQILKRGLQEAEYSVDLIADYIKYGMYCWDKENCLKYYERIKYIDKSQWNWRAYSFSIDYLLETRMHTNDKKRLNEIKEEALQLAELFIDQKKQDQAFFDKASIYRAYNDCLLEKQTLQDGIKSVKKAPKCLLRLADIAFEEGEYSEAIEYIKHCMNYLTVQPEIDRGYAYLLMALGNAAILFENYDEEALFDQEVEIKKIYRGFHTALVNGLDEIYKVTAETTIRTIVAKTGVEYEYNDIDDTYFM